VHGAICLLAAGWTLLDELDGIVTPGDLTVLIATGTHRGNTPAELGEMLGAELAARLRVINQDARYESMLTWRGVHGDGVPVWLNRHWADADVKITTGFVEPYFFAGFSGGPKLVAPGLGAWRPRRPCTTPELLLLRRAVGHGQPDRQESHQVQAMAHLRLSRLRPGLPAGACTRTARTRDCSSSYSASRAGKSTSGSTGNGKPAPTSSTTTTPRHYRTRRRKPATTSPPTLTNSGTRPGPATAPGAHPGTPPRHDSRTG